MEKENNSVTLDYERPTGGRLLSTRLFDIFISLLLGFFLFFAIRETVHNSTGYKTRQEERQEILISSELYIKSDEGFYILSDYLNDSKSLTPLEKTEEYEKRLTYFYSDFLKDKYNKGSEHYLSLKENAKSSDNKNLFDEEGKRTLINSDYNSDYLSFYQNTIENDAIGYLQYDQRYLETRNWLLRTDVTVLLSGLFSGFLIMYFVFPLIFYRAKATLGMKLNHLGLVNYDAIGLPFYKWLLRTLFVLIFEVIGSVMAFLIPLIIDITFIFRNKNHQSLADYIFQTFTVSVKDRKIYLSKKELLKERHLSELAEEEVKELHLKQ